MFSVLPNSNPERTKVSHRGVPKTLSHTLVFPAVLAAEPSDLRWVGLIAQKAYALQPRVGRRNDDLPWDRHFELPYPNGVASAGSAPTSLSAAFGRHNPVGVDGLVDEIPRVGRRSSDQPWAGGRKPFGLSIKTSTIGVDSPLNQRGQMNIPILFALLFGMLTLARLTAAPEAPLTQIQLRLETFRLPKSAAETLLLSMPKDSELYTTLRSMVLTKTATLANFMLIHTKSGQRCKLEQIDEFPYVTDFDPGQIPQMLTLINPRDLGMPVEPATLPLRGPLPQPQSVAPSNGGIGIMTTITPTTFTVRNLGETLEIDPTADLKSQRISMALATESVQFVGFHRMNSENQPQFETQRLQSLLTVASGKPTFLGTLTKNVSTGTFHSNEQDELSLAFITATIEELTVAKQTRLEMDASRFQWEIISLPKAAAVELLDSVQEDRARLDKLRAMVKTKSARLEMLQSLRTENERSKLEEIDEFPYPTDFDPPEQAQILTIADQRLLDLLHEEGGLTALAPDAPLHPANAGFGLMTRAVPTTFTVRNLGGTLEMDSVVSEDKQCIDVTMKAERPRLLTVERYEDLPQPRFECPRMHTSVVLGFNEPLLVSTMSPPINTGAARGNTEDRVWLAFLTAIVPTEAP
jgi:hypothetical protein